MTKTAKIYGDSLYDLAAEEKLTEEILPQMEQVAVLFKENPDYLTLLSEPSIPKTERVGLLDKAFEGQLSLYLLNFLKLYAKAACCGNTVTAADSLRRATTRTTTLRKQWSLQQ